MSSSQRTLPLQLPILPDRWSRVDHLTRLFYLESCRMNLKRVATFWVEEEAELRGHSPISEAGAESWFLGPIPVARTLRYLEHGLQSGGRPLVPSVRLRIDGRSICRVFPFGFHEGFMFWGYQGHVWSVGSDFQGQDYARARDSKPGPALVLGASNVSSIAVTDVLSKLFCENRPVVCLLPRRFAPLAPLLAEVFHPLVRDRHLHFVVGGPETGRLLLQNPIFETVHLTGSPATYQTILSENHIAGRSFTSELGCVTPLIVVPGKWKSKELVYHARHLVSLLTLNGGYNCVSPQVVLVSQKWPQKEAFWEAVRAELARHSRRDDHFPNSAEKRKEWRARYPKGEIYGPRTLVKVSPYQDEPIFSEEAFCGMLAWAELKSASAEDFLTESVAFCNDKLWGDLSCAILVDSLTRRDSEVALAHSLTTLHYGTVGVNVFTGLGFFSSVTPWGSYRGGRADTGSGWVHNNFFFDRPEKSVLEGPFVPNTVPPWFKPFPRLYEVGRSWFHLDLEPSQAGLAQLAKAYGRALWKRRGRRFR
jgi:acyl-CoA reductase-like NAD-dependent aldehyde dehydrogenase